MAPKKFSLFYLLTIGALLLAIIAAVLDGQTKTPMETVTEGVNSGIESYKGLWPELIEKWEATFQKNKPEKSGGE